MKNALAPRTCAEDGKVEQFYDDTERKMAESDSKYQIIIEDFNAKLELIQKHGSTGNRGDKSKRGSLTKIRRGTQTNHSKYAISEATKQIPVLGVTRWTRN